MERAQRVVYCSPATVDRRGRPRVVLLQGPGARCGRGGVQGHLDRGQRRPPGRLGAAVIGTRADGLRPAPIWPGGPTGDGFVALRLDPWRVQAKSAAAMAAGDRTPSGLLGRSANGVRLT